MEPEHSTTRSSAACELRETGATDVALNLPEGEGFHSLPPQLSLAELIQRNQQLRRWFPAGLPTEEERWQRKGPAEFRL